VRRILTATAAAGVIVLAAWLAWRAGEERRQRPIPGESGGVTVEVLNATGIAGLARATTRQLRHAGIDVVYFGTAPMDTLQRTRIAVRRGDSTSAVRIRAALGVGQVVVDPDPRLLLDATVLLGHDAAQLVDFRP